MTGRSGPRSSSPSRRFRWRSRRRSPSSAPGPVEAKSGTTEATGSTGATGATGPDAAGGTPPAPAGATAPAAGTPATPGPGATKTSASGTSGPSSESGTSGESGAGARGGRRRWRIPWVRSLAGQVFLFQVLLIVLLIAVVVVIVVLQAQRDSERDARNRSMAVAQTLANSPGVVAAFQGPDPAATLQPRAEAVRRGAGVDYIVVLGANGVHYADPNPELVRRALQDPQVVQRYADNGRPMTATYPAGEGKAAFAVVPVRDEQGRGLGLVAVAVAVGRVQDTVDRQMPVILGTAAVALTAAAGGTALVSRRLRRQTRGLGPTEMTRMYEHHDAVLHAVREGVLITNDEGRVVLLNDEARRLLDLPPDAEGRHPRDLGLDKPLTELLGSDREADDEVHRAGHRLLAVNKRPTAPHGGMAGSVTTLRDSTELRVLAGRAAATGRRLRLLYEAGVRIGTTLDVVRTAEELTEVAVPGFAGHATVELVEQVLRGEEPPEVVTRLRRVASYGVADDLPLYPVGETLEFGPHTPLAQSLAWEHAVRENNLADVRRWWPQDTARAQALVDHGLHSFVTVPLRARGVTLGVATFWRTGESPPFEDDDLDFAEELGARAAVAVDNARRYSREHTMAVTLQRSLLPHGLPEQDALETAYRYLPAEAGVGGDWFDVIPLPGARVALVVGDVVGHGLHAAATMGRLRTAVHNFSSLDLPPDEILGHLDELVTHVDQARPDEPGSMTGATCLYAVYDPVAGHLTVARAGHLGPAVVGPGGDVSFPDIPVMPPLGLGAGLPVDTARLPVAEGSRVVLFTDGLIESREREIDEGLDMLAGALAATGPAATPEQTCAAVFDALLPARPADDIALLVARTRLLRPDQVATWDVDPDPAAVAPTRAACACRLESWGLDDLVFTTELIVSELVTNAIRYGSPPVRLRLLRDRALVCEVSDGSSTSPHLGRAATTDEGGRGLFLVARYAERWGTRYTPDGKVIWAEQSLHGRAGGADGAGDEGDALLDQWGDL